MPSIDLQEAISFRSWASLSSKHHPVSEGGSPLPLPSHTLIESESCPCLQPKVLLCFYRAHGILDTYISKVVQKIDGFLPIIALILMVAYTRGLTFSRTLADLQNKITSFSHKGYNQPYFLNTNRLLRQVRAGEDLFERKKELYDRIDDNPDVPAYLQTNETQQKFDYMLDRDPWHANFHDLREQS